MSLFFIGFVIGLVMGLLAGKDVGASLQVAIKLAGVMYIQPKMISILMEGMVPVSEGAQKFLEKRAPGRDLYIGLDPAIGTGKCDRFGREYSDGSGSDHSCARPAGKQSNAHR